MNLSKRGEYALRALIDLGIARELGRPMLPIGEIADHERIPVKFLEQILLQLKDAGYLASAGLARVPMLGDRVLSVDGAPLADYVASVEPYYRYSTVANLWSHVARDLDERGTVLPPERYSDEITYELQATDGTIYEVTLPYVDEATLSWIRERNPTARLEPVFPDKDPKYLAVRKVDLGSLEPLIALPDTVVNNSHPVKAAAGTRIDQAYIGSCANGTLEDLDLAARVVKGRRVAAGTRFIVTPASQAVYRDAVRSGAVQILLGILYVAFGIVLVSQPVVSALILTYVLGLVLAVSGFVRILLGITHWREAGWIMLLSGIFGVLAGAVILTGWPMTGLWVIGFLLGVDLIAHGLGWLAYAWRPAAAVSGST